MNRRKEYSRSQMLMPMLLALDSAGGSLAPADAIDRVADALEVPADVRQESVECHWAKWGKRTRFPFRQEVHWARHDAVARGLLDRTAKNRWTITPQGRDVLHRAQPGIVLLVWETPSGQYLWGDAIDAAGISKDGSVQLYFMSPPFPLGGKGRKYGNLTASETISLLMRCAPHWHRSLAANGSLVLDLKDCWNGDGTPTRSLYIEKLLLALCEEAKFFFCDRHVFRNPACQPTSPFVTVQKIRAGCDWEQVLWLGKSPSPKADARKVMVPAQPSTIASYLAKAKRHQANRVCESGQNNIFEEQIARAAAGEEIRVLPRSVQTFANSDTLKHWKRDLAEAGLPAHPARMPLALAKWWITFLTDPGDTVKDDFCGSGTTALAAEQLGRRWIGSDYILEYALGSALRFPEGAVRFDDDAHTPSGVLALA